MKKLLQMKFMLLLCMLVVGSGTMWAQTSETISANQFGFTSNTNLEGNNATLSATNFTLTFAKNDASNVPAYNSSSKEFRLYKAPSSGKNGGSITIASKSENTTFTKIEFTFSNLPNNYSFSEGLYDKNKNEWSGTATTSLTLYNTDTSGQLKIKSMKIYYETTSSYTITAVSNNTELGTVSLSGTTITASPKAGCRYATPAYTVSPDNSATVAQDGNTFTVTPTANTTVTINFEAIPTHTASFSVNGTVTTPLSYEEGADIIFPENPDDIDDYVFVGWITTSEYPTGSTPELITSATMGTTDITYYAVYAKVSQDGEPEEVLSQTLQYDTWTYNGTTTDKSSYRLFGNGSYVESASLDLSKLSKVKIFGGTYGGSDYKTVTIGDGTNVWKAVEMTGTNNAKEHSFTEGTALTGNKPLRIISTCGNGSSSGIRMSKIEIYVLQPTISYSDHTTTVVADTRQEAGLGFVESTAIVEWYNAAQYTGQALTNPHSVSPITWTSSNEGVATVENGTVTVLALGETTIKASFDGDNNYKKGEASYTLTVQDTREEPTVTIHNTLITHTDVHQGTAAGHLTASVKYNDETIEGATVTWSGDNDAVATINATSGSVDLVAPGTVTFTATYAGNEYYSAKTATYEMTVTDSYAPGTVNNPYTVALARAAIDANTGVTGVYATGIVSEIVTAFNSQYGNITYNISADGLTTSDQLQAYRGKSYNGNNFTSADDIQVGDVVIISGNLTKYGETYEFAQNNELYFNEPRLTVADADKTVTVNAAGQITNHDAQTITINYRNFLTTAPSANNISVVFCDVNGIVAAESYDWIEKIEFNEAGNGYFTMSCSFNPNTGEEARTGYAKVAFTAENTQVSTTIYYSDIITITQDSQTDQPVAVSITLSGDFTTEFVEGSEFNHDGVVVTATYSDESTADVTELATFTAPDMTLDPTLEEDWREVTVSYGELSTHYTIHITALPTHTVQFFVYGEDATVAEIKEGTVITFPEVSDKDGMTFIGWMEGDPIHGTTDTRPNIISSATMGTENVDYRAVFALFVPGTSTTYTDELTYDLIGVTGTSYSDWDNITDKSGAVYAGNSAGDNDAIQLRSKNKSGIVTTASGGKLKKVSVVWNSNNTADERTLDIYGKNNEYTSAADLYGNAQGTKVGSISKNGTTMELTVEGDYEYVGLRSNSGAMYLDKITIEWEAGTPDSYTDYCTDIPVLQTVTIAEACTDGKGKYYGTYSSSQDFKVPANITVSEIGINNDGTMNVQNYATGDVVKGNTGVMLSTTKSGEFNLVTSIYAQATTLLGDDNCLRPSGDEGIDAYTMEYLLTENSNCKFYRLTMHNGTTLGFWWGATDGAGFNMAGHKAYLAVPKNLANARSGFAFDNDVTGISNVNVNLNDNENCYDLQGRKVSKPGKGLYIVNGRKVVIK